MSDIKRLQQAVKNHGHSATIQGNSLKISEEPIDVYGKGAIKYITMKEPNYKKIRSFFGYKSGGSVKKFVSGGAATRGYGKARR